MDIGLALKDFISSEKSKSIIFKGSWGIGKTYFWDDFLRKNIEILNHQSYSYVSLFGISSIDDLKFQIFQNSVSKNLLESGYDKLKVGEKIKELFDKEDLGGKTTSGVKSLLSFKNLLGNYSIAIEKIAFQSFNNTLICFDDLERKSHLLTIKELFGLASLLKEKKNCSIIFIVNDDQIDEFRVDYDKYKEKTIDREILLDRSITDCFDIIFMGNKFEKEIFEAIQILQLNNLRVLQRIKFFIDSFFEFTPAKIEQRTKIELLRAIILFTWMRFDSSDSVPEFDFLKSKSFLPWNFTLGEQINNELTEEEEKKKLKEENWTTLLNSYNFDSLSSLDEIIWRFISEGTLEEDDFLAKISERDEIFFKQGINNMYDEAWNLYHNSFADNKDEFLNQLTAATLQSLKFKIMNVANLSATLDILSDFGQYEMYDRIKQEFEKQISEYSKDHLEEMLRFPFRQLNSDVKTLIETELNKVSRPYSFQEIMDQLAYKNSWGGDTSTALANKTEKEFFDFFSTVNSEHLDEYIKVCLRFRQDSDADHQGLSIAEKTKTALIKIGRLNPLNKMRIEKKYKIDISEKDN